MNIQNANWIQRGFESTKYLSLLVKAGNAVQDPEILDKFSQLANFIGFNPESVTKIFAIQNKTLISGFEGYRNTLYGKHRANPALFKKTDWKMKGDLDLRQKFMDTLVSNEKRCFLNKNPALPAVLPMLQGTTEEAVWQICQQGFAVVATTDGGFFGQGIYFTSNINYASQYAGDAPHDPNSKVFLLALVIPGNSYPVTEVPHLPNGRRNPRGLFGKGCQTGYQSHFTIVPGEIFPMLCL